MNIALIILAVIEAVVIVFFIVKQYKGTSSKKSIVQNAEKIVGGELSIEDIQADKIGGDDAVIANGLNLIKSNLLTFVESTKQNVVVLSDSIGALTESMNANQQRCELIASNSQDVDETTSRQLSLVEDNLRVIEENSVQMQEMVDQIDVIMNMLNENVQVSENGMTYLEKYAKEMDVVSDDLNVIGDTIARFNQELKQVYDVGDFIVGISNQLKLLSFNASIEAARAGQAGRGFVVVADEMTNMSEQTREGVERINEILNEIIASSAKVTESIDACASTYNKSKEKFEDVNKSFRTINTHSSSIQTDIIKMSDSFKVMAANTEETRQLADDMCITAQSINEKTGNIAASSQEVASGSVLIGENAKELNGMLAGIQKLLKKFNTGVIPVDASPKKLIKIAIFSMYDNDFWYNIKRGAVYAKQELADKNVLVDFVPLIPDDTRSLDDVVQAEFDRIIAEKYDGLIYPGFIGGIKERLIACKKAGMKLMTFNCDISDPTLRLACLRPDAVDQGVIAGQAAVKLIEKGDDVVILYGNPDVSGNVDRNTGFRKIIEKLKDCKITGEVIVADDGDDVYRKTYDAIKKYKPDLMFLTNGFPIEASKAIIDAGAVGKTKLVAFDLSPALFPYIRKGIIGAVVSQDAFGQGHDPVIWLYNHIVADVPFPGEYIGCRVSVADRSNIDDLLEA